MVLPAELNKEIIDFLTSLPSIEGSDAQQTLINGASLDSQLQSQIKYPGSPAQFINLLVPQLIRYGELKDGRNALEAVLESARNSVGQDKKKYCDELLQKLHVASSSGAPPSRTPKKPKVKRKSNSNKLHDLANWTQIASFIFAIAVWIWPQPDLGLLRIVLIIAAYILYALITIFLHLKSNGPDWNFARWIGLIALTIIFFLLLGTPNNTCDQVRIIPNKDKISIPAPTEDDENGGEDAER